MEKVEQLRAENVEEVAQVTEDLNGPEAPTADLLWVFNCELNRGHSVTTMAWNKKNPVTQLHSLI